MYGISLEPTQSPTPAPTFSVLTNAPTPAPPPNAGFITLCVNSKEYGITAPLAGATVQCWDEDIGIDDDDVMTNPYTTRLDGCVTLAYAKRDTGIFSGTSKQAKAT